MAPVAATVTLSLEEFDEMRERIKVLEEAQESASGFTDGQLGELLQAVLDTRGNSLVHDYRINCFHAMKEKLTQFSTQRKAT